MKNFLFILLILLLASCSSHETTHKPQTEKNLSSEKPFTILSPKTNSTFRLSDTIEIVINIGNENVDSIQFWLNQKYLESYREPRWKWIANKAVTGQNLLRFIIFQNQTASYLSISLNFLAKNPPKEFTYKIVNVYPHDPKAYTQGLFYHNNFLYETTGEYRKSSLRQVDYMTGKILKIYNLPDEDFGEGMTIVNNKIYMLTWEQMKGYVFNLQDFSLLYEFPISSEGWGLTFDGTHLIRSDGSHRLYFMTPEHFTEVKILEVYDNNQKVLKINELEYINNLIYANIYGQDYIVMIDPNSGAVVGKINLSGILSSNDRQIQRVDVLNGIAWDSVNQRLFVTGKWWPKMFEIKLIEIKN
ncbi:MAG TPA: glutaminyl-peptide cyclotransferase [Salinivirgaceae bacterium]|nr:glutaminyl-peptide cyclotransferase [Salinivirgaceae bacterium]